MKFTEKHYNGSLGTIGVALQGYNKISNDAKRSAAYKLSKMTDLKSGKIFQGAKSFANGAGKFTKALGPAGTALGVVVAGTEIATGKWDAHTVVNVGLMITAGAATLAGAPVVLTGIAIYGVADYFFDISEKIDSNVGRKADIWK